MSLKHANAAAIIASTTGAGVPIGTNVDISSVILGSAATTVSIYANGVLQFALTVSLDIYPPIALNGPVTATSSGGVFAIAYVPR